MSGGPAWTPGQEDRVWGHTKFLSIYYRLLAQRNKEGDRGRGNGSPGLSYPRNQASQPSWNGVGQQGGGGAEGGAGVREGAGNRAEHSLPRTALLLARCVGARQAQDHRPAKVATGLPPKQGDVRNNNLEAGSTAGPITTAPNCNDLPVKPWAQNPVAKWASSKAGLETARPNTQGAEPGRWAGRFGTREPGDTSGGHQLQGPSQSCQTEPKGNTTQDTQIGSRHPQK